ncbi:MAG: hypothetical protein GKR88_07635 [Flavobacteriaceae bacterium]|nr:MAG: hypothetical protein GKR88_07635 [Flavobacteriaceae bacterium]
MKSLDLNQMEQIDGGGWLSCSLALIGAGVTIAAITASTAGVGAAIGFSIMPSVVLLACSDADA